MLGRTRVHVFALLAGMLLLQSTAALGQATDRRPLDHDVYDGWNRISGQRISDDGRWVVYAVEPQDGDGTLHVRSADSETAYSIKRGSAARFSGDGGFVVFLIEPELVLEREEGRRTAQRLAWHPEPRYR